MYRLSLLILVLIGITPIRAQSPHGDELEVDCALCHNPESWSINYKTIEFDHIKTNFILLLFLIFVAYTGDHKNNTIYWNS